MNSATLHAAILLYLMGVVQVHSAKAAKKAGRPEGVKCILSSEKKIEELSKLEGHMKPLGSVGPYFEFPTMEGFPPTPREFFNKYVIPSIPLLMKNAAKTSPAFTKWKDAYLLSHPESANERVFVKRRKSDIKEETMSMMSFKQFVKRYNTNDMLMIHSIPNFMKPDVTIPPPLQCEPVIRAIEDVTVWLSSEGAKSVLHKDDEENINCLYRGNKTSIFMNPYGNEEIWKKMIFQSNRGFSSLNVDAVDFTKFPDLATVRYAKVNMKAGDCLYIPYGWYHQVNTVGGNLVVNFLWKHENERFFDLDDNKCGDTTERNTIANISFQGTSEDITGLLRIKK